MEVHHHPHIEKKGFKEYFLEFIMIFLAVTMGFIAENIREHFEEKKSVQQYLQTYQQELVRNEIIIKNEQQFLSQQEPLVDSLATIFDEQKENDNFQKTIRLFNKTINVYTPGIETAAYQQMVNAGGLKAINNLVLKDSMALYIGKIDKYRAYNADISNQLFNTFSEVAKVIDIRAILKNDTIKEQQPFSIHDEVGRRTIVFLFADLEDQYVSDLRSLKELAYFNQRLQKIVSNELKK